MPNIYVQNVISGKIFEVTVSFVYIKILCEYYLSEKYKFIEFSWEIYFFYYIWSAELRNNIFAGIRKQSRLFIKFCKNLFSLILHLSN